jgi:hypothetical protein
MGYELWPTLVIVYTSVVVSEEKEIVMNIVSLLLSGVVSFFNSIGLVAQNIFTAIFGG